MNQRPLLGSAGLAEAPSPQIRLLSRAWEQRDPRGPGARAMAAGTPQRSNPKGEQLLSQPALALTSNPTAMLSPARRRKIPGQPSEAEAALVQGSASGRSLCPETSSCQAPAPENAPFWSHPELASKSHCCAKPEGGGAEGHASSRQEWGWGKWDMCANTDLRLE